MFTLDAVRILIESIINGCWLNLMAWKASAAHRSCEDETKTTINNHKIALIRASFINKPFMHTHVRF